MVTGNKKTKQTKKPKKVNNLRYAEYYDMQGTFDELFAKSKNGEVFGNLSELIFSRDNILLAYRNIEGNGGSVTPGTDGLTIRAVEKYTPEALVQKVRNIVRNYNPRAVRRKEIPKQSDPSKTRPLGIPCIWDRLIQQCILQVLEPICEAKFSENSYGFRPNRSCEHAVAAACKHMQLSHMQYVVEFDIKGFFDNVDHSKLIKQMWALGIQDKRLIYMIKRILKAPVQLENGAVVTPDKGTPQGGIISPLLANIVLNELDWWVDSQWQNHPVAVARGKNRQIKERIVFDKSHGYTTMRRTNLKEMHIVRYAHLHRSADGSVAGPALVGVTVFTAEQVGVDSQSARRQAQQEYLVGQLEVVLDWITLGPLLVLQSAPPWVCLDTHTTNFSLGTTILLPTFRIGKSGSCISSYPLDGETPSTFATVAAFRNSGSSS